MASLHDVPSGERIRIAFFGRRNAGKSSVVNAVTGQNLSVVSEVKGTTTDPVSKAMELLPLGAVLITDTAGIDDTGELGQLRVEKSLAILEKTDIAVLIIDSTTGRSETDSGLIAEFRKRKIPYVLVYNKSDLAKVKIHAANEIAVSAKTGANIPELKELLAKQVCSPANPRPLLSDFVNAGDLLVLVIPIDESAPKGRLILPQQQVIRAALEIGAVPVCCRETELQDTLAKLAVSPRIVITDSQAFGKVSQIVPEHICLTSFSILMARYKGDLETLVKGAFALDNLKNGDRILISEGCTHHRQCNDIGTVKLPRWIQEYTKCRLEFSWTSGNEFPADLHDYALIVHCGGCMLSPRAVQFRQNTAKEQAIPMTNYGTTIAQCHGILKRSLEIFKNLDKIN